jgi:hypothetical protein
LEVGDLVLAVEDKQTVNGRRDIRRTQPSIIPALPSADKAHETLASEGCKKEVQCALRKPDDTQQTYTLVRPVMLDCASVCWKLYHTKQPQVVHCIMGGGKLSEPVFECYCACI